MVLQASSMTPAVDNSTAFQAPMNEVTNDTGNESGGEVVGSCAVRSPSLDSARDPDSPRWLVHARCFCPAHRVHAPVHALMHAPMHALMHALVQR